MLVMGGIIGVGIFFTPRGFDRLSPFAATVRRPDEVLQLNLDRFAAVLLTNVGNLSDALVSRLEQESPR